MKTNTSLAGGWTRWLLLMPLLAAALLLAQPAKADPAGRVGRIALLTGTVHLNNPQSGEAFVAPLNQPLTGGDIITTEPGARAEIQIGSATVRLDGRSRLEFDRLDDDQIRLYLADGSAIVRLPTRDAVRDFVLETRNGRFLARDTGIYRFDAEGEETRATAYFGTLRFDDDGRPIDIPANESAQIGSGGIGRAQAVGDEFTHWSAARDRRQERGTYNRYVSPEMTGAADLDDYGTWSQTPDYGTVWYPRGIAADWAPYRDGHWAWVAPWGWTWVGHEPWGFAPFHYGRWVTIRGAWAWVPGTRVARPIYAPALVAWIGSPAAGMSLSFGSGPAVGWFPLAPREVYVPVYRVSPAYVRNVNVPHVHRIEHVDRLIRDPNDAVRRMHYAHRDLPRAVTVVPAEVMTHRRPVAPATIPPRNAREWREQPLRAAPPLASRPEPRVEPRSRIEPRERQERPSLRREREMQAPRPERREAISAPAPQPAPAIIPRNGRSAPEMQRPEPQRVGPQARPERGDARRQEPERASRHEETVQRQQREKRVEPRVESAPPPVRERREVRTERAPERPREAQQVPQQMRQQTPQPMVQQPRPEPRQEMRQQAPQHAQPPMPREIRREMPAPRDGGQPQRHEGGRGQERQRD